MQRQYRAADRSALGPMHKLHNLTTGWQPNWPFRQLARDSLRTGTPTKEHS